MAQSTVNRYRPPLNGSQGPRHIRPTRSRFRRTRLRRRIVGVVLLAFMVFMIWLTFSLGGALLNPALGSSFGARFAEWARSNGGASVVNWVENEWYSHHPPPVGGPAARARSACLRRPCRPSRLRRAYLPTPKAIVPFRLARLAGEGEWSPVGRRVNGVPAIYETSLRPDAVHTSYVVGVAWMDTKLLRAPLYSGSWIPGGGPYPLTAPFKRRPRARSWPPSTRAFL